MPRKARHRKPKRPDANPRLVAFLERFHGMSRAQATSAAARARSMGGELQAIACMACGDPLLEFEPAHQPSAPAVREAQDAHRLVCGEHAA